MSKTTEWPKSASGEGSNPEDWTDELLSDVASKITDLLYDIKTEDEMNLLIDEVIENTNIPEVQVCSMIIMISNILLDQSKQSANASAFSEGAVAASTVAAHHAGIYIN